MERAVRQFLGAGLAVMLLIMPQETHAYDPQYLQEVVGRQAISFGDTLKTVMILVRLDEKLPDFVSQKKFLNERGLLPKGLLEKPATAVIRRGELAYVLFKVLKLKGGIKARLFGTYERFAMEELIYQGIMRPGHRRDLVTGQELLVMMDAAGQYMLKVRQRAAKKASRVVKEKPHETA